MTSTADAAYADGLAGLLADTDSPGRRRVLELMGELLEEAGRREAVRDRPTDEELLAGHRLDMERRGLSSATLENRRGAVRWLMAGLAPRSVLEATAEDIQGYLDNLGIGAVTRRNYVNHYRVFFRWCVAQAFIGDNPTDDIVAPKRPRQLPRPFSDAELARRAGLGTLRSGLRVPSPPCLPAPGGLRGSALPRDRRAVCRGRRGPARDPARPQGQGLEGA